MRCHHPFLVALLGACTGQEPTDGSDGSDGSDGTDSSDGSDGTDSSEPADDTGTTTDCEEVPPSELGPIFQRAATGAAEGCDLEALAAVGARMTAEETGPWGQEVHLATSTDGYAFEDQGGALLTRSAVPEVVVGDDGSFYLFVVDGDWDHLVELADSGSDWIARHGFPGFGALRLYRSEDGLSFDELTDFDLAPSSPEALVAMNVDPEVLRRSDGTWLLYFVSISLDDMLSGETWAPGTDHDLRLATSTDLVHWTEQGVVVTGPYADPAMIAYDDQSWEMLSFGLERWSSEDGGRSFHAEGTFSLSNEPSPLQAFAPDCLSLEPESSWRCFYSSMDGGAPMRSMRFTQEQGWLPDDQTSLDVYGEAASVMKHPTMGWMAWFHTFTDPDDIPDEYGG